MNPNSIVFTAAVMGLSGGLAAFAAPPAAQEQSVREQPTRLRILWGESPHAVNCSISDG
jgi:hypothetical protein